jgi:hypothetical protein
MWNSKKIFETRNSKKLWKIFETWNPKKLWKIFEGYEILKYCEKYLKHMRLKKKCENIINRKWPKESSII